MILKMSANIPLKKDETFFGISRVFQFCELTAFLSERIDVFLGSKTARTK